MAFPLKPPGDWFDLPEADMPTPLTFQKDGKVYGHIALWGSCHTGFLNGAVSECVQPPPSKTDYQHYHLGVIETQEGRDVRVGKITYDTGHAPLSASAKVAADHYDHTGSVGAFVRARNGSLGIWVSGAVRSDISPEGFRDLRANPPSGDWRGINRNLELIAALAVPVPGFPISKAEVALAASADGTAEVETLILPAWKPDEELALVASVDYQERKKQLTAELQFQRDRDFIRRRKALSAAVLSGKMRDNLPDSAFVFPKERRYPIHDINHARNALARAAGTSDEAAVKAAVCKRYKQLCSDD